MSDGSASLRDYGIHRDVAAQRDSDRAGVVCAAVQVERVRSRSLAAGRKPADLHAARKREVQPHQQILALHAERVGQKQEVRVIRRAHVHKLLPHLRRRVPVGQVGVVYVERDDFHARHLRHGDREAGPVLHLPPRADHPAAGAAHQNAVAYHVPDQRGQIVVAGRVVRGDERHRYVRRPFAQRRLHLARALRHRVLQKSVFGYRSRPLHRQPPCRLPSVS